MILKTITPESLRAHRYAAVCEGCHAAVVAGAKFIPTMGRAVLCTGDDLAGIDAVAEAHVRATKHTVVIEDRGA